MKRLDTPTRSPRRGLLLCCGLVTLWGAASCGGGGGGDQSASNEAGTVVDKPGGGWFFATPNKGGYAQEPRIRRQMYGRLVEISGLDSQGLRVPMFSDFVIAPDLVSDGVDYLRELNAVTAQEILVVLRDVTDTSVGGGRDQFFDLVYQAEQNLTPIHDNDAQGAGLYSMVARNSAVIVEFDDLIDEQTLDGTTFKVNVGNPPLVPFEARVFMDPNHGDVADFDLAPGDEFYSTRVIVDTTVTEIEAFAEDPPLVINGVGLPPSADVNLANVEARIPTRIDPGVGQLRLLLNPSGHAITVKNNGPVDFSSSTQDVVRAARSGGPQNVTGDAYNGFLLDQDSPQLVGATPLTIDEVPVPLAGVDEYLLPRITFESVFCSQTPRPGDVLRQTSVFVEVIQTPAPPQNGVVMNVPVRVLLHPFESSEEWLNSAVGQAQFLAAYDVTEDYGKEACFVQVYPDATGFPEQPTVGIHTSATYTLRFSEPMDPSSLTAFDSVTVTRKPVPLDEDDDPLLSSDYVVGNLNQSADLQAFTYAADLPLAHETGTSEAYYLSLASAGTSPTDLAGNPLADEVPQVTMTVDPLLADQRNGGRVSRFADVDEEPPFGDEVTGPLPEWSGQHLYDLTRELIKPRPVVHFNVPADRSQPIINMMTAFGPGVQTPLSGFGSIMQTVWRYPDFGWSLSDTTNLNLDVEGIYWAPSGGDVVFESFTEFQISVGHSARLPDEYIDPGSLFPMFQTSGLLAKYTVNWADLDNDKPKIVHEKYLGYEVHPGDLYVHPSTGTKLMPFPWNRKLAPEDWSTWTWRNTALRIRAGKKGGGAPLNQEWVAAGQAFPPNAGQATYVQGQVRTDGLPMLMEFRCYPDDGAVGLNAFDISLAANSSSKPYFRAFTTGGISSSGPTTIDPDTETTANGGFDPSNGGAPTYGRDNSFYIGAADFVVRVSRSYSVWFPATNPFIEVGPDDLPVPFDWPVYNDPITEPRHEDQPDGTAVTLAFRGATAIHSETLYDCNCVTPNRHLFYDALTLDPYGDYYEDTCLEPDEIPKHNTKQENAGRTSNCNTEEPLIDFLADDPNWRSSIDQIHACKFYQVRVTLESNTITGLTPELSAIAVSWQE